jgi:hypothetical protein
MQPRRFTLILTSALAALTCVGASSATARPSHPQTLLFDAIATHERTAGPGPNQVGHEQIASGILRNGGGHTIGRFAFTCTWIKILAGGDALERCTGSGRTRDGLLEVAGPARESKVTGRWTITASSGAYHGANGTVALRDISDHETLITATVTPRTGTVIHVGVIPRPAANAGLIARADELCAIASRRLAALPPFPFSDFDPLHPDARLPQVGAFFTGPGDPRPTFGVLESRLRGLPQPRGGRDWWHRMLEARTVELAVINQQDTAALNDDTSAFVRSVHANVNAFRQIAITATVFGATQCIL